jgi:hypothetical protein
MHHLLILYVGDKKQLLMVFHRSVRKNGKVLPLNSHLPWSAKEEENHGS